MNKAIIGVGSNIDPEKNIEKIRELLRKKFTVKQESSFVKTKPVGYLDQDDFINGSIYLETDLDLGELKKECKKLEEQLGKRPTNIKFGPRPMDLDVVVFNGSIVDQDFYERDFLKSSCLELIPNLNY